MLDRSSHNHYSKRLLTLVSVRRCNELFRYSQEGSVAQRHPWGDRARDVEELRGYMRNAEKLPTGLKVGKNIPGILVHGGARKLSPEVRAESRCAPQIELVQFSLSVGFTAPL